MRVRVDRDVCDSHGQCAFTAPEVFTLKDDGTMSYREDVPDELRERVEQAALVCPAAAVEISG